MVQALNNMPMSGGVQVTPRFIFGANGQLNNCLHLIDDRFLIYVAGHNIVVYNLDDGSQQFIPGSENATQINFVAKSMSGRYIAYCERAQPHAQVTVYEVLAKKKRKTLPEPDMENLSIECREFLGCAFSPTTEQSHLITLSGEPDWQAILWQWDQFKMLAKIDLNIVDPVETSTFQISLN